MSSARQLPTLDREVVEHLQESLDDAGGDFVRSLAQVFQGQAVELVTEISSAAEQGDLSRLQRAAHSLKGSSATLGGARLAAICDELEHWEGSTTAAVPRVAELQAEQSAFQAELGHHLEA